MEIAHSVPPSYDTQTLMPTPTPQSVLGTDAPLKNTSDLFFSMWEKFGREPWIAKCVFERIKHFYQDLKTQEDRNANYCLAILESLMNASKLDEKIPVKEYCTSILPRLIGHVKELIRILDEGSHEQPVDYQEVLEEIEVLIDLIVGYLPLMDSEEEKMRPLSAFITLIKEALVAEKKEAHAIAHQRYSITFLMKNWPDLFKDMYRVFRERTLACEPLLCLTSVEDAATIDRLAELHLRKGHVYTVLSTNVDTDEPAVLVWDPWPVVLRDRVPMPDGFHRLTDASGPGEIPEAEVPPELSGHRVIRLTMEDFIAFFPQYYHSPASGYASQVLCEMHPLLTRCIALDGNNNPVLINGILSCLLAIQHDALSTRAKLEFVIKVIKRLNAFTKGPAFSTVSVEQLEEACERFNIDDFNPSVKALYGNPNVRDRRELTSDQQGDTTPFIQDYSNAALHALMEKKDLTYWEKLMTVSRNNAGDYFEGLSDEQKAATQAAVQHFIDVRPDLSVFDNTESSENAPDWTDNESVLHTFCRLGSNLNRKHSIDSLLSCFPGTSLSDLMMACRRLFKPATQVCQPALFRDGRRHGQAVTCSKAEVVAGIGTAERPTLPLS